MLLDNCSRCVFCRHYFVVASHSDNFLRLLPIENVSESKANK